MTPLITLHYDYAIHAKTEDFSTFIFQNKSFSEVIDLQKKGYELIVVMQCDNGVRVIVKNPSRNE